MRTCFLLTVITVVCSLSSPAFSADLFIDNRGEFPCDDSRARGEVTATTPWCSLHGLHEDQANDKLSAGDIVHIRGGIYSHEIIAGDPDKGPIRVKSSGTASSPIVIKAFEGESVTIRGGSFNNASLLEIRGDYITLDSLDFVGYIDVPGEENPLYIVEVVRVQSANHITLQNLSISEIEGRDDIGFPDPDDPETPGRYAPEYRYAEGWGAGIHLHTVTDATIDNLEVSCTSEPDLMELGIEVFNQAGERVWLISSDGLKIDHSEDVTVRNSTFSDCTHNGFYARWSDTITAEENTFENRLHSCLGFYQISGGSIRNNEFVNCNTIGTGGLGADGNAIQIQSSWSNDVYNNLVYVEPGETAHRGMGITVIAQIDDINSDENRIFNNLIYRAGRAGIRIARFGNSGGTNPLNGNLVQNNLVFGATADDAWWNTELTLTFGETYSSFDANNGFGNRFDQNLLLSLCPETGCEPFTYTTMSTGIFEAALPVSLLNEATFAANNIGDTSSVDPNTIFVDPDNGDFRPTANSPVIDAGSCEAFISTDKDGTVKPSIACDIGPYEFIDSDGDLIAGPSDNCPNTYNPDQVDTDGDGSGDLCDATLEMPPTITGIDDFGNYFRPHWIPDGDAPDHYNLEWSKDPTFSILTGYSHGLGGTRPWINIFDYQLNGSGTYYFRIAACDSTNSCGSWSNTASIEIVVPDGPIDPPPTITSVAAYTWGIRPYWSMSEDPPNYFKLEVADTSDFSNVVFAYSRISGTRIWINVMAHYLTESGTYYVRMQSCDTTNVCGGWSNTASVSWTE